MKPSPSPVAGTPEQTPATAKPAAVAAFSWTEHAQRELRLCGQTAEDPGYAASIVAAIAALTSYGHTGESIGVAINQLHTLLRVGTLSPLTSDPEEWEDRSDMSGFRIWQNVRCPAAMSFNAGVTFWLVDDAEAGKPPLPVGLHAGFEDGKTFYRTIDPVAGRDQS